MSFAGHRQLDDPAQAEGCLRVALAALQAEAAGEWIGVSSAAAGSDLLFARNMLAAGFSREAILPLPAIDFQKDFSAAD